ncbi:ThuA domain-containing protein [Adhaeribacter swui]|uniref:ThuA domain-containing protein n=1 Tax=Adhaeribacter swui TaxID=2086471 RepID=A0A7G7GA15_9BACT|nr:ThuA domain-containing protein [Adhaeribacter swui]QNF33999.1 ThuA domain-containing protein [Adhaeribacter swui]
MNKLKLLLFFVVLQLGIAFNSQAQKQFKVLLVTTTKGWHHESVHAGVLALQQLGARNFFDVVLWEDPNGFTDKYLEQFKAVVFLNTTGDIFDEKQQKVLERFVQSGKGFVGIHSASDTEYEWPWYTKMVGRMFHIHPTIQTAKLKILDPKFPGLQGFADDKLWTEEYYEFGPEKTTGLNYILSVDETSYNPKVEWGPRKGEGMGKVHPLAWYHNYDGGRAFYTALGHLPTNFSEPAFLNHLLAGIFWAATGKK